MTERAVPGLDGLREALSAFASGVTLVTVADGRDDIGTTVSAFCPLSLEPPLLLVALMAGTYPAEVLARADRPPGFAVTLLAAGQRALAGRFAAAGRPGARLLLDGVPCMRGMVSAALIPEGGLAALDCAITGVTGAGDHVAVTGTVMDIPYASDAGDPLVRFRGRYPGLRP